MLATDEARNTCELCMEPYSKQRIPKILPCFHSFCLSCLTRVASRKASATEPRTSEDDQRSEGETAVNFPSHGKKEGKSKSQKKGKERNRKEEEREKEDEEWKQAKEEKLRDLGKPTVVDENKRWIEDTGSVGNHGNTFLCPTCRTPVNIPAGGVAALQTNFYLDGKRAPAEAESSSAPLCEMCEGGQDQEQKATLYCYSCQQRMCRSCRRMHDLVQGARDHRVQGIQSVAGVSGSGRRAEASAETGTEVSKWCQYHPDQLLRFQCLQCKASICLHCKITSHEGHKTEDMATAVTRIKEELSTVLAEANQQLQHLDVSFSHLEQDEADVKRQKQEVEQQVNFRFDVIMSWARRARDEFLQALEAKETSCLKDVRAEMTAIQEVKDTLSGLVTRTVSTRKTSPGTQWVLAKNELQAALLSDDKVNHFADPVGRARLLRRLDCSADQDAIELELIRLYIGRLSEEEGTGSDKEGPLTLRGVVTAISELGAKVEAADARTVTAITELKAEVEANDAKTAIAITKLEDEAKAFTAAHEKEQTQQVSFHAVFTQDKTINNGYLTFDSAISNQGGGYDTRSGAFTAPVAGAYVFTAMIKNAQGQIFTAFLNVNGHEQQLTSIGAYCTVNVVVPLDKGSEVRVRVQDSPVPQHNYNYRGYRAGTLQNVVCQKETSLFRGHLLS